jgi:hypothetical protein
MDAGLVAVFFTPAARSSLRFFATSARLALVYRSTIFSAARAASVSGPSCASAFSISLQASLKAFQLVRESLSVTGDAAFFIALFACGRSWSFF